MLSPGSSHLGKRDVICRETCFCSRVQASSLGPSGAELTQGWVSAPGRTVHLQLGQNASRANPHAGSNLHKCSSVCSFPACPQNGARLAKPAESYLQLWARRREAGSDLAWEWPCRGGGGGLLFWLL